MTREEIIRKMQEAGLKAPARGDFIFIHWDQIAMLLDHERASEREACKALHQHEDVLAPVGNSAWGEAHQEGWAAGTAAYRDAIRARGQA